MLPACPDQKLSITLTPVPTLATLPLELLLEITSHLPLKSQSHLIRTNQHLHARLSHLLHSRLLHDKSILHKIWSHTHRRYMLGSTLQWAAQNGNLALVRGLLAAGCWEAVELPPPLASQCNWGGGYAMAVLFAAGATLYWSEGHKGPVIERCRSTAVELAGEGGEVEVVRALMEADGRG